MRDASRAGTLRKCRVTTPMDRHGAYGFSLIELLTVVAILGLMIQLMLPAVMASREAASRLSCSNNLRQTALAIHAHHETYKRLPSGGWNYLWAGEPELGTGREQPGSWVFNILSFLDQADLRNMGRNMPEPDRSRSIRIRCATPLAVFYCPSRRAVKAYTTEWAATYWSRDGAMAEHFAEGAKSDFAACTGSAVNSSDFWELEQEGWEMPKTLKEGNDPAFLWPTDPEYEEQFGKPCVFNGVIYGRSQVRNEQITDGLSKVYLVGEKFLPVKQYETGLDPGDLENVYSGFNDDTHRAANLLPRRDSPEGYHPDQFGGPHPTTWNMAFCDGSVRPMNYDMYLEVHRRLGGRDDGKPVSADNLSASQ